jgi:hypothetical protein
MVHRQRSRPNPTKVHVISKTLIPLFIANVCAFLGFTKYYKTFIHGNAKIARLLFDLMKKVLAF